MIPPVIVWGSIKAVEAQNQRNFGVALLNTRTQGEINKFVLNVERVESADQTPTIWTPASSIKKVFSVSETLNGKPEILKNVINGGFATPNIYEAPLKGEFLQWQIRYALDASGEWKSEQYVQDLFRKVNAEIDVAFDNGKLKRTSKIGVSTLVPRQFTEIIHLFPTTISSFIENIFLQDWRQQRNLNTPIQELDGDAAEIDQFGLKALNLNPKDPNSTLIDHNFAVKVSNTVLWIYRIIVLLLCIYYLVYIVMAIARRTRKRRCTRKVLFGLVISLILFIYAFTYTFVISWFCEYLAVAEGVQDYVKFFMSANCTLPFTLFALLLPVASFGFPTMEISSGIKGQHIRRGYRK